MENKLAFLISVYEDERNRLQKMLDNCLVDMDTDYLSAHYCSIAISRNNYQLQLLKHLEDPLYYEKLRQLKHITFYEMRLADEVHDKMKEYYEQIILKAKKETERLNQIPKRWVNEAESSVVDDFLLKLLSNQLIKPELILNKTHNLILRFRYLKKRLVIKIPFLKKHIAKQVLYEERVRLLVKTGFQMTTDENSLVMFISGEKDVILKQTKSILSKIVFEIFHYSEFENETFLSFTETVHH